VWIETIGPDAAEGRLKAIYARIAGAGGEVDNILKAHALRPHTLEGHMALYKAALHHPGNALSKAFLESVGVYVSLLNGCHYCVEHHYEGLKRQLKDDAAAERRLAVLMAGKLEDAFDAREAAALRYAGKLTRDPAAVAKSDVAAMRAAGLDDGEILEINQVAAYFAYANRVVLGLGVSAAGEPLGLSPGASDDPDDWSHG